MTRSLGRPSSYLSARCTIFEQVREWLTPPRFRAHAHAFSDTFTAGLRICSRHRRGCDTSWEADKLPSREGVREANEFEFALRRELITIRNHPFYGRHKRLLEQDDAIEGFVRWNGEQPVS